MHIRYNTEYTDNSKLKIHIVCEFSVTLHVYFYLIFHFRKFTHEKISYLAQI